MQTSNQNLYNLCRTNLTTNLIYQYLNFNHIRRLINRGFQKNFYFQTSSLINSLEYLFHSMQIENRMIPCGYFFQDGRMSNLIWEYNFVLSRASINEDEIAMKFSKDKDLSLMCFLCSIQQKQNNFLKQFYQVLVDEKVAPKQLSFISDAGIPCFYQK
ncbi:unnamed protein product (macronuclear) [Paramecium tetraurelia]|uniref:Uncharacterized protein n=1 Tax=Paramecium tetraurelia TaxID=5888 RepID=A0BY50_PARTE|nr:uncharacterized protein GSPATT00033320001 [Paramecium tetraurelia]CAK63467.1 unnamed protein product [Paramecium tetraurelia]|eukprot:XP_001430865.1 hypothetical protein (macronuclear) [Paramecium tetraurelia strain d4-2]